MLTAIILKILVVISYFGMLLVNYLANSLPLNNRSTGEISDMYPTLFTPSGFTFSIWAIIYLFLGLFVFRIIFMPIDEIQTNSLIPIMVVFIVSSLLNITWLFLWHYDKIGLSTIAMIGLLVTLLVGYMLISNQSIIIRTPFSLYAAWISVALIANISIFLVKSDFSGFGIKPEVYTALIIIVAGIIGIVTIFQMEDLLFGLVFMWALFGILMRHINVLNHQYPIIIYSIVFTMIALSTTLIYQFIQNQYHFYG
jgi:hypothetical protein